MTGRIIGPHSRMLTSPAACAPADLLHLPHASAGSPALDPVAGLVVRYDTSDRGVFFVQVPAGRWYRILKQNSPGACQMLP